MRIYCTDIQGLDESAARLTGRTSHAGSAFALSLLAYAAGQMWGLETLPEISEDENGKPFFPDCPARHFSLSHTRTHVLCALSGHPVGADAETIRDFPEKSILRLTDERERRDFEFVELWTLRESLFKLFGHGSLRTARFRREGRVIVPPVEGVNCRVYKCTPRCVCAACSMAEEPPRELIIVPASNICT